MQGTRICLALTDRTEMQRIKAFLTANGFVVVDEAQDGASAIRRIRALRPDLVLVDYDLPGLSGLQIAKIAEEDRICPAIVVRTGSREELKGDPDIAYLFRPITKSALLQTIHLVLLSYRKVLRLQDEITQLRGSLLARKTIEKAKGILMSKWGISEEEAYRWMQKISMDRGVSMKDLAQSIVKEFEING